MLVSPTVIPAFISCIMISIINGSVYGLTMISDDIKLRMHFNQEQWAFIMVCCSSISNLIAPFCGTLLKKMGFTAYLIVGLVFGPLGYALVYAQYTGRLPASLWLMCVSLFMSGAASTMTQLAVLQSVVTFAKKQTRGFVLGIIYCSAGSCALILSFVYKNFLKFDSEKYLVFCASLYTFAYICGTIFVRPQVDKEEAALGKRESNASFVSVGLGVEGSVSEAFLKGETDVVPYLRSSRHGGSQAGSFMQQGNQGLTSEHVEFSAGGPQQVVPADVLASEQGNKTAMSRPAFMMDFTQADLEDEYPTLKSALFSRDYIMLAIAHAFLVGASLMLISNAGQVVNALVFANHSNMSLEVKQSLDAAFRKDLVGAGVSLISIGNLSGRFMVGLFSDVTKVRFNATRGLWIFLMASLVALGCAGMSILLPTLSLTFNPSTKEEVRTLATVATFIFALGGAGYGCWLTMTSAFMSERFPTTYFVNLMGSLSVFSTFGGVCASWLFGKLWDQASKRHGQPEGIPDGVCAGTDCFATPFRVALGFLGLSVTCAFSVYLSSRSRAAVATKLNEEVFGIEDKSGKDLDAPLLK